MHGDIDIAGIDIYHVAGPIVADVAAVMAALMEAWSNGQTEGEIAKLKLVKRQMYGRAQLALLRARLLASA